MDTLWLPCPTCGLPTRWYWEVRFGRIKPVNDPPHYCPRPTEQDEERAA